MLFISLILSALLLLAVNGFARRLPHPGAAILGTCLAFLILPLFLTLVLPPLAIQALLICGAVPVWRATRRGPSSFLSIASGASLIAYGLTGLMAWQTERGYARLRERYPYESIEARLPLGRPVPGDTPLHPVAISRLDRLEAEIPGGSYRQWSLRWLHDHAVDLFINSPGFGISRMGPPTEASLAGRLRDKPTPPQPGPRTLSDWSPGEFDGLPADDETRLGNLLDVSIVDFVNPRGFGFFKDRRRVAGFETHRFGEVPRPKGRWTVQTLDLVGLLLHDEPRAYVSADLPKMDRLHPTPTRPLDRFEGLALISLRQGDDIFTARSGVVVRMLGAVRSTARCLDCHGGERGDLLGAFSYTLRSSGP